jgi:DNA polymerase III alpha subunit
MSQFKTILSDYTLWYDGMITIDPLALEDLFLKGIDPRKIAVSHVNSEIIKYNRLTSDKIGVKDEIDAEQITFDWKIPQEYLDIDIKKYVYALLEKKRKTFSAEEYTIRKSRVDIELNLYKAHDVLVVLNVLIYTVDMFRQHSVVWGVGRGSSCASYILFLIGIHSVDSIKYNIPLVEFFK